MYGLHAQSIFQGGGPISYVVEWFHWHHILLVCGVNVRRVEWFHFKCVIETKIKAVICAAFIPKCSTHLLKQQEPIRVEEKTD